MFHRIFTSRLNVSGPKLLAVAVAVSAIGLPRANALSAEHSAPFNLAYSDNPIKVVHYSDGLATSQLLGLSGNDLSIPSAADVSISFVNTAKVPATSVSFTVRRGNSTDLIIDKGAFGSGAVIVHNFAVSPQLDGTSDIEVQEATFADGTRWERP